MTLFGRVEIADAVGRNEAPVFLLTGDSGIGKSRVLLSSTAARQGWIAPPPRSVHRQSGAFYAAYLDSLADALAVMVEEGVGRETVSNRLLEMGRTLGNERLSVLGRVAFDELVALVRGRIGDDVGKSLGEFVAGLVPDDAARVAARANSARDPLTVELLAQFAEVTADLAGELHLALSFDQAERLGEDDLRLVTDLADHLPRRFHIRLAFATDDGERSRRVASMTSEVAEIDSIEIGPINDGAVADWLEAEGLDRGLASTLHRQTSGYPLLVETAIEHVRRGNDLADFPRDRQFARRTQSSWLRLSADAQTVARTLSVLPDPLPESDLRALSGIEDVSRWATVIEELRTARILSVPVDGQLWFHVERRRFVLADCLTPEQRDEIASATADFLWERGFGPLDFRAAALFAQVVEHAPTFRSKDTQVDGLGAISRPALAVAAALLELAVEGRMASNGDVLVSHALAFIDAIEDPIDTIEELERAGLIATARNDWMTGIAASWTPQAQAFLQGRAGVELRRSPVLRLAESMFNLALRPKLDAFASAHFGIGSPSLASLGRIAEGADENSGYVNRGRLGNHLLLRGALVGDAPFWLSASYEELAERDRAADESAQVDLATPVGRVRVTSTWRHPQSPVPLQRFARALARAKGERVGMHRDTGDIRIPPLAGLTDEAIADLRVRAAEVLYELASPVERVAMELDEGYLLAWLGDEMWSECIVQGGAGFSARRLPALREVGWRDHFRGLRIRQALGLSPFETVSHLFDSSSRHDPLAAEIGYRRKRARRFNSAQPHVQVPLHQESLQSLLEPAFQQQMHDSRAFRESFPLSTSFDAKLGPRAVWLAIAPGDPVATLMPGAQGSAHFVEGPSPDDDDHVFVQVVEGERLEGGFFGAHYRVPPTLFDQLFPDAAHETGWSSDPRDAIAELTGHHPDDIRPEWPNATLADPVVEAPNA